MSKNMWIGLMMISVGLLVLGANMGVISGIWVLVAVSAGLLITYAVGGRHLGFLIPGLLTGGLTIFAFLESRIGTMSGAYLFFFFAAAFYLVYALHTRQINTEDQGERIWPLFPGTALLGVGALVLGIEGNALNETFLRSINMVFPAALILIGIFLFVRNMRAGSSR